MHPTIFQRLIIGYLAIMILVISLGSYVVFQLNLITRLTHLAADTDSEIIQQADALNKRLQTLLSLEKKYWISDDRDFYQLFLKRKQEFLEQVDKLELLASEPEYGIMFQELTSSSDHYFHDVEQLEQQDNAEPSADYNSRRDALARDMFIALTQIEQAGGAKRDEKIRASEEISHKVLRVTVGFAAVTIVLGLIISYMTTRSIVRPIVLFQKKTRDIGSGNFVTIDNLQAPSEILQLADEFNTMSERLRELDTLKEDFISHVSHSLRTPLTAIKEASEMLITGTFDKDPDRRFRLLTIVRDECKRLIVSVNRILDLSRMEGKMMEYQFTVTDLNTVIQTTVASLEPLAENHGIELHFTPRLDTPPVLADEEQIIQLLENLIGNAIKFTAAGGSVEVRIQPPADDNETIQIAVADTGCGIEPEYMDFIFQKFQRIEQGNNTIRGTGLGLAIAKHIVTAHGGNIWVESNKDQGSTFYFSLPPAYFY